MATIEALQGNCFADMVLNGTGNIENWSAMLEANNLSSWTPDLYSGQVLQIPANANINIDNVTALKTYPTNNGTVPDIFEQIDSIFGILAGAMSGFVPDFTEPIVDTNVYYTVPYGVCFVDLILNSTGDITNWEDVLNANEFGDRNPILYSGERVLIPASVVMNLNNYRALNIYPSNNNSVPDVYNQINAIFDLINNPISDWILYNPDGVWSDEAHYWRDGAKWLD